MAQVIGVPKETFPGEKRVATVPDVVQKLAKLGFGVLVQSGAGEGANIADDAYAAGRARTSSSRCARPAARKWR
jgi:H+-translocating NAD(P) transhydrogenase subunit alpha